MTRPDFGTGRPIVVGDVVTYDTLDRPNRWCREGLAIADERGGRLLLLDTFWCGMTETHVLTEAEKATAVMVFNIGDYDELPDQPGVADRWRTYHPDDRERITGQHGLTVRYFVRRGSRPDHETRVENAREAVEDAERAVRVAESRLKDAQGRLADILAEIGDGQ
jgi:hypothetical protein